MAMFAVTIDSKDTNNKDGTIILKTTTGTMAVFPTRADALKFSSSMVKILEDNLDGNPEIYRSMMLNYTRRKDVSDEDKKYWEEALLTLQVRELCYMEFEGGLFMGTSERVKGETDGT